MSGAVAREFLANVRRPDGDPIRIEPDAEGFERADKPARRGYDPQAPDKPPRKKYHKD